MDTEPYSKVGGLVLGAACCTALLALVAAPVAFLFTAPFFLLAAILVFGGRPGDRLITMICRLTGRRRYRATPAVGRRGRPAASLAAGSGLIAANLAGRAPPIRFA